MVKSSKAYKSYAKVRRDAVANSKGIARPCGAMLSKGNETIATLWYSLVRHSKGEVTECDKSQRHRLAWT